MTLFEYIAVAASLICSFVAVRILGGVAAVLRSGERYWVHAAWIFLQLWLLSVQWWLFWAYRDVEWSYGRFILALTPLGLLYLLSAILIPANVDQVVSWRQYYFDNRVRFFGISLATLLVMISNTVVFFGHPRFQSPRVNTLSRRRVVTLLPGHCNATMTDRSEGDCHGHC
jgi:hypothetical protein